MGSVVLVVFLTVDAKSLIYCKYNLSSCEPHFFHYPLKKATAFAEDTIRTPEQLGPLQISAFIMVIQAMKSYEKNGIDRVYVLPHPHE